MPIAWCRRVLRSLRSHDPGSARECAGVLRFNLERLFQIPQRLRQLALLHEQGGAHHECVDVPGIGLDAPVQIGERLRGISSAHQDLGACLQGQVVLGLETQ